MYGAGKFSALHYLDDCLFFGQPGSEEYAKSLSYALATCRRLGVSIAEHKFESPACCMTLLGIEIEKTKLL